MTTLGDPGRIGSISLRNRTVMAPMTTRLADPGGHVTPDMIEYYAARARGGVGMIIVEMASPERCGRHRFRELGICDDDHVAGLRQLATAIRRAGAVPAIQLGHGGGHTSRRISGEEPIAPSAVSHPVFEVIFEEVVPQEMSRERIDKTVAAFARAAVRAAEAGFELLEIHAAHGYLISQFLCPAENKRSDAYGGSLENRARIGMEILRCVCAAVPGLAVSFRYDSDDFYAGGLTADESLQVGQWAQDAGASVLHLSGGHYRSEPSAERMIPPMRYPDACFAPAASRLRSKVGLPIILAGRLGDPEVAQKVIREGTADFVALGRPLLADPLWPARVIQGQAPRPCLGCNTCVDGMRGGSQLRCLVNPVAGRERHWSVRPLVVGERVAVVGAGPAGLSCARELAPHNDVTVFDRDGEAGGAFRYAAIAPLFQNVEAEPRSFQRYTRGMLDAIAQAGGSLALGCEPKVADLAGFDRVIFATGARYRFGLGGLMKLVLERRWARSGPLRTVFRWRFVRDLLYYSLRRPHLPREVSMQKSVPIHVVGDARRAGKSVEAIESAFAAVYGEPSTRPLRVSENGKSL